MTYLLDTNVLSELEKRNPDPGLLSWVASHPTDQFHVSVLTIGEIVKGIEAKRLQDRPQAERFDRWAWQIVQDFDRRIVDVDLETSVRWGKMRSRNPPPEVDGLIAATAVAHGLTLVTRNVSDFVRTGVKHVNPFSR